MFLNLLTLFLIIKGSYLKPLLLQYPLPDMPYPPFPKVSSLSWSQDSSPFSWLLPCTVCPSPPRLLPGLPFIPNLASNIIILTLKSDTIPTPTQEPSIAPLLTTGEIATHQSCPWGRHSRRRPHGHGRWPHGSTQLLHSHQYSDCSSHQSSH